MATNVEYFMYARKSSESEDRQEQSIEDQINRLKERANSLGISVKEILTEAKSAKQPGRPVFNDMLNRIKKGEAQGILCWQINRLSRNPIDSGALSWMLQQGALKAIQTMEREYLPEDNVLLFSVESGMANQFIIELRKNTKRGMHGKADRGWFPSKAPAGYINERLEHTIQPDPERFDLIRKMWDLMLTGNYTPVSIAEIASKEWGYRSLKSKRSGGVEMAPSVIYKMFKNIFYTGNFEWGKKIYRGNHKPMITLEEYDRVQAIFGRTGKPRGQTHEFAFTGLIRCGLCGAMYTGTEKTKTIKKTGNLKTYTYYHCSGHKKGVPCPKRNPINLIDLEQQIELLLEEYTILPEFQTWAIEALNRNNDKEIEERTKIYEMQHKTVVESQTELDNLTKMRYRDLIDDDMFVKERDTLKEKITRLQAKLRETEGRASKWLDLTEQVFSFACFARKEFVMGNLQRKREIFSALGQNFYIKNGKVFITANEWLQPIKEAYPEFRAEFERLGLREYTSVEARNVAFQQLILEWGAYRDSNPD
ncbi:recombinase family protein [Candidatus Nomurabacteria bacterium]|nr:recombinase family protein [Candidatus Nomurabacteria bacterium]